MEPKAMFTSVSRKKHPNTLKTTSKGLKGTEDREEKQDMTEREVHNLIQDMIEAISHAKIYTAIGSLFLRSLLHI